MKFEQLLQVYWSKGFYYGGRMRSFNLTIDELFEELDGLGPQAKLFFLKRFEYGYYKYKEEKNLALLSLEKKKVINMYLGQMTSVNNEINELLRYNLIRLYLIKCFRGKAMAVGKPSHGQRTWSNAWTAYKLPSLLKNFINEMKKTHSVKKKAESKNKKILKKKTKTTHTFKIKKEKKIKNLWF